ncbi:2-keto-4-pentenoate hydratase [Rhodococcus sp. ACPA4]|uniref:2-keto-4-pentenoate hydratase n=1 Tax=Nocardia globerula TaxID=1818 RepID=A0A652YHP4_NOCGL|nr:MULTISPECIES: fumarylacetoacetate hydrolase family protein [Rhodococcus]NMD60406.1 2-keto-4-pentenoate hydratase [Nocardia globerula]KJF24038.1 2-keto-4-pentenoate hydratase [Rhodococcus sp. AD45]MCE4268787.1 fumarylacetoacetate hydrolase family protein [Rhodococcus globerulus]MDV8069479.1 fumarylacetoacetate hydrolase family protein [Rhodococcus sp. IEGM 1366]NRI69392.1 2-keto-4-pentenoate hydratase [Rhodococcus sp. MS16]
MSQPSNSSTASETDIAAAADRLATAAATGVPCAPVRDLIGSEDLVAAYAVQRRVDEIRRNAGAVVVGRKIGLTSVAVQQQLGVDQPDLGVLYADMDFTGSESIPMDRLIQPKVEAEVAFVLGADLVDGPLDNAQVRDAIEYSVAAIEICDSRIESWDIKFGDTVADNASSGVYVLGTERHTLAEVEPADVVMSMSVDGTEVSTGVGTACLGDPIEAVVWLARTARELGQPLTAGQVILSGALGPMAPVVAGNVVTVNVSGLGSVTTSFSTKGDIA